MAKPRRPDAAPGDDNRRRRQVFNPCTPLILLSDTSQIPRHALAGLIEKVEAHSLEVEGESGVVLLDENTRSSLDGLCPDSTLEK